MPYGLRNNAKSKLTAGIGTTSTSVSVTAGEGGLFIDNSIATLEHKDSDGNVIKREVVLITNISGDTLTIQRAYGPCVIDDTAENKEMQALAQSFSAGDTLSIYLASEMIQDIYSPVGEIDELRCCINNCHDTRMQQVMNKICQCYGDISRGSGCDGDCVISGCVYLDASKEYQFNNLTICSGACVRFVNSGLPKIHVKGKFINYGTIDLRGGCAVGNNSFTNCYGTISNNYCASCYNVICFGCGGKGGQAPYTTATNGPKGGDGGNANMGGTGNGGTGGRRSATTSNISCANGNNGANGQICGGGGGGGQSGCISGTACSTLNCSGINANGFNGGNGGFCGSGGGGYTRNNITGGGGGGGGGGFWTGCGGNGGFIGQCCVTCCVRAGGFYGGNGGNGGIRGKGGCGGTAIAPKGSGNDSVCHRELGGFGGKGGNGQCGGNGGNGQTRGYICAGNITCGGDGGKGILKGGNGGCGIIYCMCSGMPGCVYGGDGGDAINNMYGLIIRAKDFERNSTICGNGGNGGNGGNACLSGSTATYSNSFFGGKGGNGGNGANIMIVYNTLGTIGTINCSGGNGGSGGIGCNGGTNGTAGNNGTVGKLILCCRERVPS